MAIKKLTIRERLSHRQQLDRIAIVEVPGFGELRILRLTVAGAMAIKKEESLGDSGYAAALLAAVCLDDEGSPLFKDATEVGKLDWALTQAFLEANDQVNKLRADDAAKK